MHPPFLSANFIYRLFVVLLVSLLAVKNAHADAHQWNSKEIAILKSLSIDNLPKAQQQNPEAVELGHKIFFDPRFSRNGKVSCASCHRPEKYFTDGLATAKGLQTVTRNTPTIVGSNHHTWLFHDGRADSLWSQALGPLENDKEHGGTRSQFAHLVFSDPGLRKIYEQLYGAIPDITDLRRFPEHAGPVAEQTAHNAWDNMSANDKKIITDIFVNLGKSIAAYEKQLQPAPSRFDNYIRAISTQDSTQMREIYSNDEVAGLKIFINKGNCILCHNGPMLSDSGFHNIATPPAKGKTYDWGRYSGAKQVLSSPFNCHSQYNNDTKDCSELDHIVIDTHDTLGSMKTPSLRNVSRTAPYMHAGQYKTLKDVLKHYNDPPQLSYRKNDLFLDIDLNEKELQQLEAFLHTLDSDIATKSNLLAQP